GPAEACLTVCTGGGAGAAGKGLRTAEAVASDLSKVKKMENCLRVTGKALEMLRKDFEKMKPKAWMREAAQNPVKYTAEQLARMRRGQAPIGPDGFPMEIHHKLELAAGGQNSFENFDFLTRTAHRLGDNYKLNHPNL